VFAGNDTARNFALNHNLAITAGSDAHFTNQFIGKAWLELPLEYSPILGTDTVIQAIKQKRARRAAAWHRSLKKRLITRSAP